MWARAPHTLDDDDDKDSFEKTRSFSPFLFSFVTDKRKVVRPDISMWRDIVSSSNQTTSFVACHLRSPSACIASSEKTPIFRENLQGSLNECGVEWMWPASKLDEWTTRQSSAVSSSASLIISLAVFNCQLIFVYLLLLSLSLYLPSASTFLSPLSSFILVKLLRHSYSRTLNQHIICNSRLFKRLSLAICCCLISHSLTFSFIID